MGRNISIFLFPQGTLPGTISRFLSCNGKIGLLLTTDLEK